MIGQEGVRSEMVEETVTTKVWSELAINNVAVIEGTHVTSVKKIFLLFGWIFASFKELNCRPKKLSRRTVVL